MKVVRESTEIKPNDAGWVHIGVLTERIIGRLPQHQQQRRETETPAIPQRPRKDRIASALQIRIRKIGAELAALAAQGSADEWQIAQLVATRKRLQQALDDMGASI